MFFRVGGLSLKVIPNILFVAIRYQFQSYNTISESVENKITDLYSVGNESFEGHIVTSRILYEYEKTIFM